MRGSEHKHSTISARWVALLLVLLGVSACNLTVTNSNLDQAIVPNSVQATPVTLLTATLPPTTPLPSLTPTRTLLPPPTFEPATLTPPPSMIPAATASLTPAVGLSLPGLRGAETPTPGTTPGCEPRDDWQLVYEVQRGDALASIADRYGTYASEVAAGNCLSDPNMIVIGQRLRVPGQAHPAMPEYECLPWEMLTPMNGTMNVPGAGQLTFNWRGPRAPRNLIRVVRPNGSFYERVIELRQNETIDLADIPEAGTFRWYVYPLDSNFRQISCLEGGPWTFTKAPAPTPTPTLVFPAP
jgi:LysM repeat protein